MITKSSSFPAFCRFEVGDLKFDRMPGVDEFRYRKSPHEHPALRIR